MAVPSRLTAGPEWKTASAEREHSFCTAPLARPTEWPSVCDPEPMLDALDHVILAVSDLDAATRDTARLLGRTPSWRGEHPAQGTANTLFKLSNTYLELLAPNGSGPIGDALQARIADRGEGLAGLAFRTSDAEAVYASWSASGLAPEKPSRGLGRDDDSGAFREWTNVHLPPTSTRGVLLFAIEHHTPDDVLPEARPLGDEASAVGGLDHAVVQTREPDAALHFYGEQLGLRVGLDREFPKWGSRMIFFRVGGATLEVVATLDPEKASPQTADRDQLWGLSWRVTDAPAAHARMTEAGISVSELRPGRKEGTFVFTVHEPTHGVPTLIKQPTPREPGA